MVAQVFFYQPWGIQDGFEVRFAKIHAHKSIFKVIFFLFVAMF